ncbi:ABC-type Zn2+ transport system substrate-binding protein/surface adhesin [Silvimonas terrae]|uniref:ABC-type Zn2+ transport system substrate-binding protein/surface adhesin n=1 Tax=Silvimonas terrae TaxID=300266 RepID=A0A840RGB0_9NEIS|nr:hypothetical protein [Silvimonas terrae]MBB5191558.1 ABC-type Zn2+ transport system substrate-binding protein/surface adhesin [Silvimonas terrae]
MNRKVLIGLAAAASLLMGSAAMADDDHHDHGQDHPPQHVDDHGHHDDHAHRPPPPPSQRHWASRDDWRRAHAGHLKGRYFDDWRTGYRYQPGQYVWYDGRAWEPARPLTETEVRMAPTPGLWVDITASFPLN